MFKDTYWRVIFALSLVLIGTIVDMHLPPHRLRPFSNISHNVTCPKCNTSCPNTSSICPEAPSTHHAPLTEWAQHLIHQHQHPVQCTKVMVTEGWTWGMGSEMHVVGSHLAQAMEEGYVLTWGTTSCSRWVNRSICALGCECIYQRLTHCPVTPTAHSIGGMGARTLVPSVFASRLKQQYPSMTNNQILYWWRAQSVAYLMRLQPAYMAEVQRMRKDTTMHYNTPYPMPSGTINIHIRGGDKYKEMTLVPAQTFVQHYLNMIDKAPFSYSRHVFLSSDDGAAIEHCKQALEQKKHIVMYTHMERMAGGHDIEKVGAFHKNLTQVVVQNLLQLFMALEADAWIGTRESNWPRLIDELRCVWVGKCERVFNDIGALKPDDYAW